MKSSAVSLIYEHEDPSQPELHDKYLVNLIDSPGHVEFSSEVWTGLKVTDGAFILIDCLEGVSS